MYDVHREKGLHAVASSVPPELIFVLLAQYFLLKLCWYIKWSCDDTVSFYVFIRPSTYLYAASRLALLKICFVYKQEFNFVFHS